MQVSIVRQELIGYKTVLTKIEALIYKRANT